MSVQSRSAEDVAKIRKQRAELLGQAQLVRIPPPNSPDYKEAVKIINANKPKARGGRPKKAEPVAHEVIEQDGKHVVVKDDGKGGLETVAGPFDTAQEAEAEKAKLEG